MHEPLPMVHWCLVYQFRSLDPRLQRPKKLMNHTIENQFRFLIKILYGVKEIFWLYKGFILSYHGSS